MKYCRSADGVTLPTSTARIGLLALNASSTSLRTWRDVLDCGVSSSTSAPHDWMAAVIAAGKLVPGLNVARRDPAGDARLLEPGADLIGDGRRLPTRS